ncbi:cytochrome d ubiquinol oxidase subunit II [Saccharopolyspora hirsuta]|uniref:Cytochrome d ubiquinol oxidase subunit II n=1 Tax=Saccharopolyspora hirsuta TaxID=1837 RepID=A0A5M7BXT5_SACHI|nr:cytochrome d ubiquinol oxidase subunit II [Saccharopolyspora hirsuta]KAA5834609.1 cytochrome d ubiquinol oxidase subunit II [Saccharopolyspora hirsuta]
MELLAIAVLGVFALGYFLLGGADIGVGMLLPALGRDARQRRLVITGIAPFFLGNEVWLVATAGILVGSFPELEGELLTGQFPAVVLLLTGWIVRDMGLWLRGRADARGWWAVCDAAITGGSWVVALSWGWMFAGLLAGQVGEVATGPGALLAGVAVATLFAVHGLAFARLRLSGLPRQRAGALFGRFGEWRGLALTSGVMVVLCLAVGFRLPLLESTADPATLGLLLPAALVLTPFLIAAQVCVWWVLRARAERPLYL